MPESNELHFATSNPHKFDEAQFVVKGFGLTLKRLPSKGLELQADEVSEIASFSARESYRRFGLPLIVEDTGLFIKSLGGFPGCYSSFAFKSLGCDGILRLLSPSLGREAGFVSAVAYCAGGAPRVFTGRLGGRISKRTEGSGGFGFDPIFVPLGARKTLGQMTLKQKCGLSHRALALRALAAWLTSRGSG